MIPTIINKLAEQGWCVMPGFLSPQQAAALAQEAEERHRAGELHRASTGQGEQQDIRPEIRGDSILWLDETSTSPAQQSFLQSMEALRQAANRDLQLGLFELEAHFAHYPVGASYSRHVDVFQRDSRRTLTVICYLNPDWQPEHGGQLRMELEDGTDMEVQPESGTLVTFLSHRFPHEVLTAKRSRLSVTGWFKRR